MKVLLETTDLVETAPEVDPCTKSWTRKGARVNKTRNRPHKWGPGKVHWLIYIGKKDPANQNGFGYYVRACVRAAYSEHCLGGHMGSTGNVTKDEPVTCLRCQAWEEGR